RRRSSRVAPPTCRSNYLKMPCPCWSRKKSCSRIRRAGADIAEGSANESVSVVCPDTKGRCSLRSRPTGRSCHLKVCWAASLVAVSPENVAYTSGHSEDTLHILRDRISATIIPADGDPIYLVVSMLENQARLYSWIKDVRGYKHDESPIKVMADILEERGFTGGNVALEKEYFTAGYYEELCGYLPKARYADGSTILAKARAVKSEEEIAFIEAAENANETAHLKVYRTLRPGDTEIAIARRLLAQNLLEGADFTNHV